MDAPDSSRRRRQPIHRVRFGAVVDGRVLNDVRQLQVLGIVANRSDAIETGLKLLLAVHRDRLDDEREAA